MLQTDTFDYLCTAVQCAGCDYELETELFKLLTSFALYNTIVLYNTVVTVGEAETEGHIDRARGQNDIRSYDARSCTEA